MLSKLFAENNAWLDEIIKRHKAWLFLAEAVKGLLNNPEFPPALSAIGVEINPEKCTLYATSLLRTETDEDMLIPEVQRVGIQLSLQLITPVQVHWTMVINDRHARIIQLKKDIRVTVDTFCETHQYPLKLDCDICCPNTKTPETEFEIATIKALFVTLGIKKQVERQNRIYKLNPTAGDEGYFEDEYREDLRLINQR